MGVFLQSLHLFKVELMPKYLNKAPGTPAGLELFLPSIVLCHDISDLHAHESVHTLTQKKTKNKTHFLSFTDNCLRFMKSAVEFTYMHAIKSFSHLHAYWHIVLKCSV